MSVKFYFRLPKHVLYSNLFQPLHVKEIKMYLLRKFNLNVTNYLIP